MIVRIEEVRRHVGVYGEFVVITESHRHLLVNGEIILVPIHVAADYVDFWPAEGPIPRIGACLSPPVIPQKEAS